MLNEDVTGIVSLYASCSRLIFSVSRYDNDGSEALTHVLAALLQVMAFLVDLQDDLFDAPLAHWFRHNRCPRTRGDFQRLNQPRHPSIERKAASDCKRELGRDPCGRVRAPLNPRPIVWGSSSCQNNHSARSGWFLPRPIMLRAQSSCQLAKQVAVRTMGVVRWLRRESGGRKERENKCETLRATDL